MITQKLRFAAALFAMPVVAAFAGCNEPYRVVTTSDGQLTVSDEHGEVQRTHRVAPEAEVTLNGRPANLQDLRPGDTVYVSLENDDGLRVATTIEAESHRAAFTIPRQPIDREVETSDQQPLNTPAELRQQENHEGGFNQRAREFDTEEGESLMNINIFDHTANLPTLDPEGGAPEPAKEGPEEDAETDEDDPDTDDDDADSPDEDPEAAN